MIQAIKWSAPGGDYYVDSYTKTGANTITCLLPLFNGKVLVCTHGNDMISTIDTSDTKNIQLNNAYTKKLSTPLFGGMDLEVYGATEL